MTAPYARHYRALPHYDDFWSKVRRANLIIGDGGIIIGATEEMFTPHRGPPNWYNGHRGVSADDKPRPRQWGPTGERVREIIRTHPDLTMAQVAERAETSISYVCEVCKKSGLRPRRLYKAGYRETMLKHVEPA